MRVFLILPLPALVACWLGMVPVAAQPLKQTGFETYSDEEVFGLPHWNLEGFSAPWVDGFDQQRAHVDHAFAHGGRASLRIDYPQGGVGPSETGAQAALQLSPAGEYYASYWLRFDEQFSWGGSNQGGKLPGLGSGQNCSGCTSCSGRNGFSARLMWREQGKAVLYLYHMDKVSSCGDDHALKTAAGSDVRFQRGRWYHVAQRVKINTGNLTNGEVDVWIDGHQALALSGLQFVDNGDLIDNFYFSTFHGGSDKSWAPQHDSQCWFDDLIVSTERSEVFPPLGLTTREDRLLGVVVVPEPIVAGSYFQLKSPDRSLVKGIELVNMEGERVHATDITFSKMGFYLPRVSKGVYVLKISLEDDVWTKKVYVE